MLVFRARNDNREDLDKIFLIWVCAVCLIEHLRYMIFNVSADICAGPTY